MSELLGDKDELSWDHEPEMNLANGKRVMQESVLLEFPSNFPTEFPVKVEIASGRQLREQSTAGIALEKRRDSIERSLRDVIERSNADRARAVHAKNQASRASLGELTTRLKGLNQLNGDREQQVEHLQQQLESMRSQSKAIEKQLQEISKAK